MSLHFVIYGAGGIGALIGAKLQQADYRTTLIARGEHARVMRGEGLRVLLPDDHFSLPMSVVEHPRELDFDANTVVLLCMKAQHTEAALADLSACSGSEAAHIVCVQNGVCNERWVAERYPNAYGCVVNMPAEFLKPGEVIGYAQGEALGILDVGEYPTGAGKLTQEIAAALTTAGFSARPDANVMRFKYAKLLQNLLNVLQACVTEFDETQDLRRAVRQEALQVYAAANIDCATKQEIQSRFIAPSGDPYFVMGEIDGVARGGGSSWQSLARGKGDLETQYLNGEISELGKRVGIATPVNDACLQMAQQTLAEQLGPGGYALDRLRDLISAN